jgi:predicted permease
LRAQAMFRSDKETLSLESTPQQMTGMAVTPSFFAVLGTNPARGRAFTSEEGEIGGEMKVILSDSLWHSLYGGADNVLGQQVRLSGRSFTVVGVMPPGFNFIDPEARFWIPLAFSASAKTTRHNNNWHNIGRLAPGATVAQVQAQVDAINAANLDRFPQFRELLINAGFHSVVRPVREMVVKDVAGSLYLLWGGAVLVLAIGAVNLANVAVARWTTRRREVATRLALGGSRTQLLRQFLSESILISVAGGFMGILLAYALLRALAAMGLNHFPRAAEVHLDTTTVAIALALSLLVGLTIGVAPLSGLIRLPVSSVLHEDSRTRTSGLRARGSRQALVGAEIGFAFVLLTGAVMLLTSFRNLLSVDPGFHADRVVTASISIPRSRYPDDNSLRTFLTRALDEFRRSPGVVSVGATTVIPFGGNYSDSVIFAEGYAMKPGESVVSPMRSSVTPGYMESLKIPLLRGRYINDGDTETSERVVVVDENLARRFWPGRDPIGQRMYQPNNPNDLMKTDGNTQWLKVVGVVRTIKFEDLSGSAEHPGAYYFAFRQSPERNYTFAIRVAGADSDAASDRVERLLRSGVSRLDPELTIFDTHTLGERAELSVASRRTAVMLAMGFSLVALLLSAIGIYGVLAYLVTQRRREIGIRIALGSTSGGVLRMILREGFTLVGGGLLAGLIAFAILQRAMASQVYGVHPLNPVVIGSAAGVLGIVAFAACLAPARRATRVNPAIVLSE